MSYFNECSLKSGNLQFGSSFVPPQLLSEMYIQYTESKKMKHGKVGAVSESQKTIESEVWGHDLKIVLGTCVH